MHRVGQVQGPEQVDLVAGVSGRASGGDGGDDCRDPASHSAEQGNEAEVDEKIPAGLGRVHQDPSARDRAGQGQHDVGQ